MSFKEELKKLAGLFPPTSPLYAVGGYVRDSLIGLPPGDADVCSAMRVEDVKNLLENSGFHVINRSLRLGTVIIRSDNGELECEYTTFRTDSYAPDRGSHSPYKVTFTSDISSDSLRRDFKMNALYLDLKTDEITDLIGGREDIENGVVSAADKPDKVFAEDGLRVLRLVRFACELGFIIEEGTFSAAKRNAARVLDISAERIRSELVKIFAADTAHPELYLRDAHFRGLNILDDLGIVKLLFPELEALKDLKQSKKYHIYDAYRHSVEAFRVSDPDIRWAALLHDIGKARAVELNGNMHGHDGIGAQMCEEILNRFKFPKKFVSETSALVGLHMKDINGNTSENKLRWFAAKNAPLMPKLIRLMEADAYASSGSTPETLRLKEIYDELLKEGAPMSIKELKVNGGDVMRAGIEEPLRGEALEELWRSTIMNMVLNDREHALEFLKKFRGKL